MVYITDQTLHTKLGPSLGPSPRSLGGHIFLLFDDCKYTEEVAKTQCLHFKFICNQFIYQLQKQSPPPHNRKQLNINTNVCMDFIDFTPRQHMNHSYNSNIVSPSLVAMFLFFCVSSIFVSANDNQHFTKEHDGGDASFLMKNKRKQWHKTRGQCSDSSADERLRLWYKLTIFLNWRTFTLLISVW